MHKKIALSALAFAIIAPVSIAFAQDTDAQEQANKALEISREQYKQAIETRRETNKQDLEVQREAGKQALETQREARKQEFEANKQEKRLEFEDKKEKMMEEKCKNIESKIATRVGRYENSGKMLDNVYGNMQARLTRLVAKLDAAKADTTQLKTDIAKLNELIATLKTDQATFMATLKESQTFVCGKSEGEFKGKLEQARKVPEIIKADREAIKNFFQTTIKTDLQAIRKTLALQKETTETDKNTKTPAVAPTVAPAPATPTL